MIQENNFLDSILQNTVVSSFHNDKILWRKKTAFIICIDIFLSKNKLMRKSLEKLTQLIMLTLLFIVSSLKK